MTLHSTLLAFVLSTSIVCAQETIVSTSASTKDCAITVYNDGFALIREQRELQLKKGVNLVRYENVAARIIPSSLSIRSVNNPDALQIREQNYQYDLLNPLSILNKSVGKTIRFRREGMNGQPEIVEGTLLNPPSSIVSVDDNGNAKMTSTYNDLVIRTKDGKVILNPRGEAMLDEVPSGLIPFPSMLWTVESSKSINHETEVSYISEGISWKADYVVNISSVDKKLDLDAWVTVDNKSGTSFKNSQLQLVAGVVKRVQEPVESAGYADLRWTMAANKAPAISQENFFEYHLYTLESKTTIADNEIKQIQLFSKKDVSMKRKLVIDASMNQFYADAESKDFGPGEEKRATIIVEFPNSKSNNLGLALPKGIMRLYKRDSKGTLQFIGEDALAHTAEDEVVKLNIGEAFDINATVKQVSYKKLSEHSNEMRFEVQVRNHKDSDVEIVVRQAQNNDWEIVSATEPALKSGAHTLEFNLNLKKGETKTVSYTIRNKW